jgi:hypothetical protein
MSRAVLALAAVGWLGVLPAVEDVRAQAVRYGTGFFVHPDGYLLTNQHVIDGADDLMVVTPDGKKLSARVVKADGYKDLALIKVDVSEAPHLVLGRSADIKVLDPVIAVGFPYADKIGAELSAYDGKVNAIRESGPIPMLQIDANVNLGNSGGPLLNDRGEVVGIVASKVDALAFLKEGDLPERINFAIPIDECKGVLSAAYPFGYPAEQAVQKREPAEIFSGVKPAVAFVVAKRSGSSKPQPSSTSTSRERMTDEEVVAFVELFVNGHDSDAPRDMTTFYVPRPIYMQYGQVDLDFIRKDTIEYRQKWPIRRYRLVSSPEIKRPKDSPNSLIVSYRMAFEVENNAKRISGEAQYLLGILDWAKTPEIAGVSEKILWRRVTSKQAERRSQRLGDQERLSK